MKTSLKNKLAAFTLAAGIPFGAAQALTNGHDQHAHHAIPQTTPATKQRPIKDPSLAGLLNSKTGEITDKNMGKDKDLVVFFGYSSCKTICTPSMVNLSRAMHQIEQEYGPHAFDDIDVVMVSSDPDGDTPEALAKWAAFQKHHPEIQYLTGQSKTIKDRLCEVAGNYNANSDKSCADPDRHSPLVYIIDQNNPNAASVAVALMQNDITAKIKATLLNNKEMQHNHHMHHTM